MGDIIDESGTIQVGGNTITIKAEPLEIELDERELAEGPARAMRDAIEDDIKRVGRAVPKLAHGAKWLARDVQVQETSQGGFELSVPGPSEPLVEALARDAKALSEPLSPPEVKSALDAADDSIVRRR